jgi:hypothetical protein
MGGGSAIVLSNRKTRRPAGLSGSTGSVGHNWAIATFASR